MPRAMYNDHVIVLSSRHVPDTYVRNHLHTCFLSRHLSHRTHYLHQDLNTALNFHEATIHLHNPVSSHLESPSPAPACLPRTASQKHQLIFARDTSSLTSSFPQTVPQYTKHPLINHLLIAHTDISNNAIKWKPCSHVRK
jgi:hypothetical protein